MEQRLSLERILPGGVLPAACPSRTLLDHVTSRWGVLVLVALDAGEQRWSELHRRVQGVSEKMLAQTLRTLEADGLVVRTARPVVPPHVEYRLSPLGADLVERLLPLLEWTVRHAEAVVSGDARERAAVPA